ncbi:alpha/beta hydrolase family protein [Nocardia pseudobrasiliensis]|uniref:Serine aminopeptidase S33 family n=1 Tax=Nocardia pseudobrasiliensis TaxID=45979 RepID=A0A370HQ12_9NOCA|nr:lipase family protein [Nocardia pseudobrasiliensis]RDI60410.1 serine aminopeptidase S33 family [Nocardia pseudobrasiliensis]
MHVVGYAKARWIRVSVTGIAAALAIALVPATADAAEQGPGGLEFYSAPADLIAGAHGSVIWSRPLSGDPGVAGARNRLVLYRSVDVQGRPVAVSGTVAVPEGPAPEGGWPLISWSHGTTGVADVCAPSRDTGPDYPAHDYTAQVRATQARWVAAGYAVAQSDYQGLGTGGTHGYLIGEAEQRAVADMALAAREVEPGIGDRWLAMGHSQGGQAAIFADARAQDWAPRLRLLGAVALAPASHIGLGVRASAVATQTGSAQALGSIGGAVASFLPLLIRGAQTVTDIDPARMLTPEAVALLPQADDRCIGQLREHDSWGGLPAGRVFRADADISALTRVLDDNDPSPLPFTSPLLVAQGGADATVTPPATDAMVAQQLLSGRPVRYRGYPGVDHRSVLEASYSDVLAWVNARFGR